MAGKVRVLCGLDQPEMTDKLLKGRRVGLMTNPTGINYRFRTAIDIINERYRLSALFGCEHGIRGSHQAGDAVNSYIDEETGVMAYSLYGEDLHMTPEMLDSFDVLVYDIQDVGARFFTYIYSLSYAMEACSRAGKATVILDRINPLGGERVQGTILDETFHSFVGEYALPARYGLTVGEYALWVKKRLGLALDLTVIPLRGWSRELLLGDLNIPWVMPSPNCPGFQSALAYIGTCAFEGTNVSEGRGTAAPFELIGAPWIDSHRLETRMRSRELTGVAYRRASFTPCFSKYAGTLCHGVQVHITDVRTADPFAAGLHLLEVIRNLHPERFEWLGDGPIRHADHILGTDALRLGKLDAAVLIAHNRPLLAAFKEEKRAFHLY
jgi:uncharacterized protein YbbC (DUF1343 family)